MTIVSNESKDIVRMLSTAAFPAADAVDLYPEPLREEIDRLGEFVYNRINNGAQYTVVLDRASPGQS